MQAVQTTTRRNQSVVQFKPEEARKRDSQADAVIEHAKRVKDWLLLADAIAQKLEDQGVFVAWWKQKVTVRQSPGRPRVSSADRGTIPMATAEEISGITNQQVSRWRNKLKDPEKYSADLYGSTWSRAMAAQGDMDVHHSSDSAEWYTPPEIIERVVRLLGTIDLDPCSDSGKAPNVPATERYTSAEDGLTRPWAGRVYMNSPYGDVIDAWVEKLCAEFASGRTTEAVALIPARVDTMWFRRFRDFAVCFVKGRLKFSGHKDSAPFPSAVVYLGTRIEEFDGTFSDIGDIWTRWLKEE